VSYKPQVSTPIAAIGLVFIAFCISGSRVNPADVYLPQLKAQDPDVRIAALRELQTSLDSRIPEATLSLLSDEGDSIRRLAARAIGSRWWQIPERERERYAKALAQNLRSESELADEKNMAERAIGLLTRRYDSKMFSRSPNRRWVIYERRGLPCLIDTTTYTEELLGWPRDSSAIEMLSSAVGNQPLIHGADAEDTAIWHPRAEAVAFAIWQTRRANTVWIWQHEFGLHKLTRSELIKLLQPKGFIDEPNPLTAEMKAWKGDDLYVSVGWGRDDLTGNAVLAWNLSQHKWRLISKEYHHGSAD
jgi:HEAT repeats